MARPVLPTGIAIVHWVRCIYAIKVHICNLESVERVNLKKNKLDIHIGEPMQIYIHWKDNSPKPMNHHFTLKEGPKVKSDMRRFPAHDILQVGFTLQASRINNEQVISTLKFGCPHLTLKEGSKVKSNHIRRFPANDFL